MFKNFSENPYSQALSTGGIGIKVVAGNLCSAALDFWPAIEKELEALGEPHRRISKRPTEHGTEGGGGD